MTGVQTCALPILTNLIINKLDILESVDVFKFYKGNKVITCNSSDGFQARLLEEIVKAELPVEFSKSALTV